MTHEINLVEYNQHPGNRLKEKIFNFLAYCPCKYHPGYLNFNFSKCNMYNDLIMM